MRDLIGIAFGNDNFVNFVERISVWRDKRLEDEYETKIKAKLKAKARYEAELVAIEDASKFNIKSIFNEFEVRQEAAQRNVEEWMENNKEIPSGRKLASWLGPHVNDHFEKLEKENQTYLKIIENRISEKYNGKDH